jgi:AcrR family transcriptional regulator
VPKPPVKRDLSQDDAPTGRVPSAEASLRQEILQVRAPEELASLSPKGRRTRQRLLDGARRAFEKSGSYNSTRISDIVKESGCAYGTFYTYFDTKEQLFYELAVEVANEMYRENATRARGGDDLIMRTDTGLRQFLLSYRERALPRLPRPPAPHPRRVR